MAITFRSAIVISPIHALWGGNPVAVKFGLQVFPPLWSGFLRFSSHSLHSGLGPVQGHSDDAQARGTEAFFHPQFHFFHTDLAHERGF